MTSVSDKIRSIGRSSIKSTLPRNPSVDAKKQDPPSQHSSTIGSSIQPVELASSTKSNISSNSSHRDLEEDDSTASSKTGFQRTSNGRLYTKDIETIFSMLMLSLNLTPEGTKTSFFSKPHPFSFPIEEAVLKVQDMCVRIVSGSTRTSMSCNVNAQSAILFIERFMSARLLHCPSDRTRSEPKPNIILQPTAKGVHFLSRYCTKNGIQLEKLPGIFALLHSNHNSMQCFAFNRDPVTDSVVRNDSFVYLLFQRMMGTAPNVYNVSNDPDEISEANRRHCYDSTNLDGPIARQPSPPGPQESPYAHRYFSNPKSDALSQYYISSKGVRLFYQKRFSKTLVVDYCVMGRAMWQWLLDCTDLVYQSEAFHLINLFIAQNIIVPIVPSGNVGPFPDPSSPTFDKNAFYQLTDTGKYLVTWQIFAAQPATPVITSFQLSINSPKTQQVPPVPENTLASNSTPSTEQKIAECEEETSDSNNPTKIENRTKVFIKRVDSKPVFIHATTSASSCSSSSSSSFSSSPPKQSIIPNTRAKFPSSPTIPRAQFPESPKPKPSLRETLDDPAMSWLFSEYLQQNHSEENLQFYKDLSKFLVEFEKLKSLQRKAKASAAAMVKEENDGIELNALGDHANSLNRYQTQIELYTQACKNSIYVMYSRFLAPNAPCELNIDAQNRKLLVETITSHLHPDGKNDRQSDLIFDSTETESIEIENENLDRVSTLFERIKMHVYRTMENDSLPKFLTSDLYIDGVRSIATVKQREQKLKSEREVANSTGSAMSAC